MNSQAYRETSSIIHPRGLFLLFVTSCILGDILGSIDHWLGMLVLLGCILGTGFKVSFRRVTIVLLFSSICGYFLGNYAYTEGYDTYRALAIQTNQFQGKHDIT